MRFVNSFFEAVSTVEFVTFPSNARDREAQYNILFPPDRVKFWT